MGAPHTMDAAEEAFVLTLRHDLRVVLRLMLGSGGMAFATLAEQAGMSSPELDAALRYLAFRYGLAQAGGSPLRWSVCLENLALRASGDSLDG